jgi:site-specific DNA-methyltransferase (adenine-specific)
MFSFTGDTVLDPFGGTGTTTIAAMKSDRNSISNEIDPAYFEQTAKRVRTGMHQSGIFSKTPSLFIRNSASCKPH